MREIKDGVIVLFRGRDLLGLPVVARDSGQELGRVKDLLFTASERRVVALVLELPGWLRPGRALPLEKVESITPEAVLVASASGLVAPAEIDGEPDQRTPRSLEDLRGQRVLTGDRRDLGRVEDLVLEPDGRLISGLEVSGGLVQDLLEGREVVDSGRVLEFGPDNLLVDLDNQVR